MSLEPSSRESATPSTPDEPATQDRAIVEGERRAVEGNGEGLGAASARGHDESPGQPDPPDPPDPLQEPGRAPSDAPADEGAVDGAEDRAPPGGAWAEASRVAVPVALKITVAPAQAAERRSKEDEAQLGTAAVRASSAEPIQLRARSTGRPSGFWRGLQLVTGFAALVWLTRPLLALLGCFRRTTLTLRATVMVLDVDPVFFGLSLAQSQHVLPLSSLREVRIIGRSGLWRLLCGLALLVVVSAVGTVLVSWGIFGRQPSWAALGLAIIALGIGLESAAYLLTRRAIARGQCDLELRTDRERLCLAQVPATAAKALLEALEAGPERQWR